MHNILKWDHRYLSMAKHIAHWSKDPSTQCGAVIVNEDNEIVSVGFNGLPRGVEDTQNRLHDRTLKYAMTIHAERNAILFARQSLKNCTMYTWPLPMCCECAVMAIQAGIAKHVTMHTDNERWIDSIEHTHQPCSEAGVQIVEYDTLIEQDQK